MDSMPPPTPISTSPARIAWSRITVARSPLAQTLLIVSEETSLGMPALICAWRDGIWPWPAWRTCPMTTWPTCSGSTPARSSAAWMAMAPSSVASMDERPPPILPMGVRAAPRITVLGMSFTVWAMNSSATTASPAETDADTVVVGVFEDEGVAHDLEGGVLAALLDRGEAKRKFKHLAVAHGAGKRWILVGLGKRDEFDAEGGRVAAAVAYGRATELGASVLCWEVPHHVEDDVAGALTEGTLLAAYRFDRYRSKADESPRPERLLVSAHHDVSAAVDHAGVIATAVNSARDLQ